MSQLTDDTARFFIHTVDSIVKSIPPVQVISQPEHKDIFIWGLTIADVVKSIAVPILTFIGGILVSSIGSKRKEFNRIKTVKALYYTWADRIAECLFHNASQMHQNIRTISKINDSDILQLDSIPFDKIMSISNEDQFKIFIYNLSGKKEDNTSVNYGITLCINKMSDLTNNYVKVVNSISEERKLQVSRIKEYIGYLHGYIGSSEYKHFANNEVYGIQFQNQFNTMTEYLYSDNLGTDEELWNLRELRNTMSYTVPGLLSNSIYNTGYGYIAQYIGALEKYNSTKKDWEHTFGLLRYEYHQNAFDILCYNHYLYMNKIKGDWQYIFIDLFNNIKKKTKMGTILQIQYKYKDIIADFSKMMLTDFKEIEGEMEEVDYTFLKVVQQRKQMNIENYDLTGAFFSMNPRMIAWKKYARNLPKKYNIYNVENSTKSQ